MSFSKRSISLVQFRQVALKLAVEGTGRIGLRTIWRLAELQALGWTAEHGVNVTEILAMDLLSFDQFVEALTGKLDVCTQVDGSGKLRTQRNIGSRVTELQPHYLCLEDLQIDEQQQLITVLAPTGATDAQRKILFVIRYLGGWQADQTIMDTETKLKRAAELGVSAWASCTGMPKRVQRPGLATFSKMLKMQAPHMAALLSAHIPPNRLTAKALKIKAKTRITETFDPSPVGMRFRFTLDLVRDASINLPEYLQAMMAIAADPWLQKFVRLNGGVTGANQAVGKDALIHLDTKNVTLVSTANGPKIAFDFWQDNEWGYACMFAENLLALALAMQDQTLTGQLPTSLLTVVSSLHGQQWFADHIDAILQSGVVSASSCTVTGNITGLLLGLLPLSMNRRGLKSLPTDPKQIQSLLAEALEWVTYVDIHMQHPVNPAADSELRSFTHEGVSGSVDAVPDILASLDDLG